MGMYERDQMDEQERPVRVLVVDDEPFIVEMLTMGLNYEGFEVSVARTGFEAWNRPAVSGPTWWCSTLCCPASTA